MKLLQKYKSAVENIEETEVNCFISTTNDPQIWFGFNSPLEYGWYKFQIKANFKNIPFNHITSKLYFDFNGLFSEDTAYEFSLSNGYLTTFYIKINQNCNQIRFDPHENIAGNVEFSIDTFKLIRQSKYGVFLDQLLKNQSRVKGYFVGSIKSLGANIYNFKKNIKANAIEFIELPKTASLSRESASGEKVFCDMTYFMKNRSGDYKEMREFSVVNTAIKTIAFYLPQFHPIKENDNNWVKGFTEWTNVTKTFSQFEGHYQPHLPGDLGFYNLTDKSAIKKQINIAKHYGIYGFCIYHYWFEGKRVLETPLDLIYNNKDLDINFMLCWANENWTKRWDGLDSQVLLKQNHNTKTDLEFLDSIKDYLLDKRYIKYDAKPVLMVYKPTLFPDFKETASHWRKAAKEMGFPDLHLISVKGFGCEDPAEFGLDALVEFPPATPAGYIELDTHDKATIKLNNPEFSGKIYDYRKVANNMKQMKYPEYRVYKGVMPSWDNTARRNNDGHIFHYSSPKVYQDWLLEAARYTNERYDKDKFLFINAWNEWAEGTHLEPDRFYGFSVLDATAQVLEYFPNSINVSFTKTVELGFCIHIYYHDLWNEIDSYLGNLNLNFHLFISIVDQGSESEVLRETILKKYPTAKIKLVENKGRDVLPFILFIDDIIESGCKYLCKIHSKKSSHREDGHVWRNELLAKLVGNEETLNYIRQYFEQYENIGIIGPEGHILNTKNYWGDNKPLVKKLATKLGYEINDEFHFIAGTMFWIRVEVLKVFRELNLNAEDFETEDKLVGIKDGTLSHAIERIFSICCFLDDRIVTDTRLFNWHNILPFKEIKRYDPNNYSFAVPIPDSHIS
ncbi:glycoside hydrolase family 99-like domain-containing protein [Pontibacter sp. H249]|uniref:glycoside hydrolase family 99-like domain-containing protein n=1 Tax=Pontibacter sp. H249 TaxID=3133420 RepID=UPI0030BF43FC